MTNWWFWIGNLMFLGFGKSPIPNPKNTIPQFKITNWKVSHQLVISTFSSLIRSSSCVIPFTELEMPLNIFLVALKLFPVEANLGNQGLCSSACCRCQGEALETTTNVLVVWRGTPIHPSEAQTHFVNCTFQLETHSVLIPQIATCSQDVSGCQKRGHNLCSFRRRLISPRNLDCPSQIRLIV